LGRLLGPREREGEDWAAVGEKRERGQTGQREGMAQGRFFCFVFFPCFYLKLFEFKNLFSFELELDTRVRFKTDFQNIYLICKTKQNTFIFKNFFVGKY
jgi:hypothetical protein